MIKLALQELGDCIPKVIGTITHRSYGVAVGIHWNYKSTREVRRYLCGLEPPNYPVPALLVDVMIGPKDVIVDEWYYVNYEGLGDFRAIITHYRKDTTTTPKLYTIGNYVTRGDGCGYAR